MERVPMVVMKMKRRKMLRNKKCSTSIWRIETNPSLIPYNFDSLNKRLVGSDTLIHLSRS